jgi:hypothetical protein
MATGIHYPNPLEVFDISPEECGKEGLSADLIEAKYDQIRIIFEKYLEVEWLPCSRE